jgi:hypothetical protein
MSVWVARQRRAKRANKLSADQIGRMESIGFVWDTPESWSAMLAKLATFKNADGHCNVPKYYRDDLALRNWVSAQRQRMKQGQMTENRKALLDNLGFDWAPSDTHWRQMFNRLVSFNERYGHPNLQQIWPEDQDLATWCMGQRNAYRKGKLSQVREGKLSALGFTWNIGKGRRSRFALIKLATSVTPVCRKP